MSGPMSKFIQTVTTLPTAVYNTALATNDTIATFFNKVQGLINQRLANQALTSSYTGGASSTANQTIFTTTIKGGMVVVGDSFRIRVEGLITKPSVATTSITFTLSVGASTVNIGYFVPTSTYTSAPFNLDVDFVFTAVGSSSGAITITAMGEIMRQTNAADAIGTGNSSINSLNTTADLAVAIGYTFSNSNASNNISAYIAAVSMN